MECSSSFRFVSYRTFNTIEEHFMSLCVDSKRCRHISGLEFICKYKLFLFFF